MHCGNVVDSCLNCHISLTIASNILELSHVFRSQLYSEAELLRSEVADKVIKEDKLEQSKFLSWMFEDYCSQITDCFQLCNSVIRFCS